MKHAIIAIEDRRFYTNEGVDLRGIAPRRCRRTSSPSGAVQGGSTITAAVRQERARRPGRPHAVPEAARGRAGLPPHAQVVQGADPAQLPEHDLLRQRRLRDRVGRAHLLRQPTTRAATTDARASPCAAQLEPQEAALLAGMVASPSAYDPIAHPVAAKRRRDVVLAADARAGLSSRASSTTPRRPEPMPDAARRSSRRRRTRKYPYFTSWIKQQVVDQLGGGQQGARRRSRAA